MSANQGMHATVHATTSNPYVFVLDWDGTIVGDVTYQSQYAHICGTLKKFGFKAQNVHALPPAFGQRSKLIRPGFIGWMKELKQIYPEVYVFIYTASEKRWANLEIGWVEKLHGIKFARPIFTRDDCFPDKSGNLRKSLGRVFPRILKTISKPKGRVFSPHEKRDILENKTIIIDNNAVYSDRTDKLLLCPDYDYAVFENLLSLIPHQARQHNAIQQLIYSLVNSGYICSLPSEMDDGMVALSKQYDWLAMRCRAVTDKNKQYHNDDFWRHLKRMLVKNQIRQFEPRVIKELQNNAWRHYKSINLKVQRPMSAPVQRHNSAQASQQQRQPQQR